MNRVYHKNIILQFVVVGRFNIIDSQEGLIMVGMDELRLFFVQIDVVDGCSFSRIHPLNSSIVILVVPVQIEHNEILHVVHSPVLNTINIV
jgi:hypothetical protein